MTIQEFTYNNTFGINKVTMSFHNTYNKWFVDVSNDFKLVSSNFYTNKKEAEKRFELIKKRIK